MKKTCPRCGGPVPNAEFEGKYPGATSRWDGHTEVCSACGTAEGILQFDVRHSGPEVLRRVVHPVLGARPWVNPPKEEK